MTEAKQDTIRSKGVLLPIEFIDEIKKIFNLFCDSNNKQYTNISNLQTILKGLDIILSEKELDECRKQYDPKDTSYITVQVIIDIAKSRLQCAETKEDLIEAMRVFDEDNDGRLTTEQFKNALTRDKISEEDANELITDVDPSSTGYIDIIEFSSVIMENLKM